jgi:hypothetical protein
MKLYFICRLSGGRLLLMDEEDNVYIIDERGK